MKRVEKSKNFILSKITSKEILFGLVLLVCCSLAYLHLKIELIEVGYEIADNRTNKDRLIESNEILKAQFLNLKSPQRIEPLAASLGLKYPTQQDIVYINRESYLSAKYNDQAK